MKIMCTQKKVFEYLKIRNLGEYHDLYVQSDTLLLADVFENFRNICLQICGPDPARFLTEPGLAWQAVFKRTKVKLDLLTNIDMLLMVEKGIRVEICYDMWRLIKIIGKAVIKNKE